MKALILVMRSASVAVLAVFCLLVFLFLTIALFEEYQSGRQAAIKKEASGTAVLPFPVGVDFENKRIVEDPTFIWFVGENLSLNTDNFRTSRHLAKVLGIFERSAFLQQLASPVSRTLVIYPGERKEEVINNFSEILGWSVLESADFARYIEESAPVLTEGKYYPGRYIVPRGSLPEVVAPLILERLNEEILSRYDSSVEEKVTLETALIIASLLEREAYDFTDMRIISGIIWNRLFIDMPLQLDATLQYARSEDYPTWWPIVKPADKFIDSPFNTYQNKGLPPAPIANVGLEAVLAALNPKPTTCYFYFHHTDGTFYCSDTYEEHVKNLIDLYGQGS